MNLPKKVARSLIISLLLLIGCSSALTIAGDQLISRQQLSQAAKVYQLASLVNPLNPVAQRNFQSTNHTLEEATTPSEETGVKQIAQAALVTDVLGAGFVVPVLMYHYIRFNPIPSDTLGYNLSVTPNDFAAQMDYLTTHGYHTVSPDTLAQTLFNHQALPVKPIIITLDDGYRDAYLNAYPILKARGMKATVFVITGFVGAPLYLTWDQINEMQQSGVFNFEAHTVHHVSLPASSSKKRNYELTASKQELQAHLSSQVNWLAYPYGAVDLATIKATQQAGFVGAFGTNFGSLQTADRLFTLPRIRISGGLSLRGFASLLPWR